MKISKNGNHYMLRRLQGRFMKWLTFVSPLLLVAICLSSAPSRSQQAAGAVSSKTTEVSSAPEVTTATYADWTLRCQRIIEPAKRICEVMQTLRTQQGQTFAQISVGKPDPKEAIRILAMLPHNITIPGTVILSIDDSDKTPAELVLRRCLPVGCLAEIEFKDEIARRWRGQTAGGRMRFKDGAGNVVVVPFSFKGLAAALDALAKE